MALMVAMATITSKLGQGGASSHSREQSLFEMEVALGGGSCAGSLQDSRFLLVC